jgi:hypothetical protein
MAESFEPLFDAHFAVGGTQARVPKYAWRYRWWLSRAARKDVIHEAIVKTCCIVRL